MSDFDDLRQTLSNVNAAMKTTASSIGIVTEDVKVLLRFMERKVVIHEYAGYVAGLLVMKVLDAYEHSFWIASAVSLGVIVVTDLVRDWYVRRVARKMLP